MDPNTPENTNNQNPEGNPPEGTPHEGEGTPPLETVSREDYNRVMEDLNRLKQENAQTRAAKKKEEEDRLKETQNYKALFDRKEQENESLRNENTSLKQGMVNDKKLSAVRDAAIRAGINPKAVEDLDMLNMNGVIVEVSPSGALTVRGADMFVQSLKVSKPHWFGGGAPRVNGNIPGVRSGGGLVTVEELVKLSNEARRSGDYSNYEAKMKDYQAQQNQR